MSANECGVNQEARLEEVKRGQDERMAVALPMTLAFSHHKGTCYTALHLG